MEITKETMKRDIESYLVRTGLINTEDFSKNEGKKYFKY